MTLRAKIEAVIAAAEGNSQKAALVVCVLLEDEIGLYGNGWFDGDETVLKVLMADGQADD